MHLTVPKSKLVQKLSFTPCSLSFLFFNFEKIFGTKFVWGDVFVSKILVNLKSFGKVCLFFVSARSRRIAWPQTQDQPMQSSRCILSQLTGTLDKYIFFLAQQMKMGPARNVSEIFVTSENWYEFILDNRSQTTWKAIGWVEPYLHFSHFVPFGTDSRPT